MSITKVTNRVLDSTALSAPFVLKTENYTIQTSDINKVIGMSNPLIDNPELIITIPNGNFNSGFQITFIRLGNGEVRFSGEEGVTLRTTTNSFRLGYPNSIASIYYTGDPDLGWFLYGDLR